MGTDILEDTTGPHHTLTRAEKYKIQKIHHNYMSRNKKLLDEIHRVLVSVPIFLEGANMEQGVEDFPK